MDKHKKTLPYGGIPFSDALRIWVPPFFVPPLEWGKVQYGLSLRARILEDVLSQQRAEIVTLRQRPDDNKCLLCGDDLEGIMGHSCQETGEMREARRPTLAVNIMKWVRYSSKLEAERDCLLLAIKHYDLADMRDEEVAKILDMCAKGIVPPYARDALLKRVDDETE